MKLAAGQTLTFYEILGPLGAGAMGEVYRARDTRLAREVALKVLPDALAGDEEQLKRFEREARALASLNHPNVAQVFGIDQVDDTCLIAMELVPGKDLATLLDGGPLPIEDAIDVCRQIAEGLEAAHEAGVIHRDLKPANVVITPDGTAKMLDFGLAKSTDHGDASDESALTTEPGRLLGTPTYMAPEQARGRPIDKRADIWAFGCVLYECLAGRRPFDGDTVSDVLAAVLEHEVDLSRLPIETPEHVRTLIERCLDKDPRTRLRDAGEARIVLAGGAQARPGERVQASRARPVLMTGPVSSALVVGAVGTTLVLLTLRPVAEPRSPLEGATFARLTDDPGTEFDADISPNGDFIVYGSDRGGTNALWVSQIDGGEPLNLTEGRFAIVDDGIRNMGFDADGSHVWVFQGAEVQALAAPKTGGPFEPMLDPKVVGMDWTRDGTRIAYQTSAPGDPIFVRDVDGPAGDPVMVDVPGAHLHFPVWSFDEEWVFVSRGSMSTGEMNLWRMRPDGSELEQLTSEQRFAAFPTPIDRDTLLFTGLDAEGSGTWLWWLDLPSRAVRRATLGLEQYTSVAASEDRRRLVATVANPRAGLWRVSLDGEAPAGEERVEPLPGVPSLRALAPQYANGELYYLSSRGSGDGLWMLRDGRAREVWSGRREPLVFLPSVSQDGRRVALVRRRGARMVLSLLDVENRQIVRELDDSIDVRGSSSWSRDGKWIVIGGIGADGPGLFRFPRDGGPAELIVAGSAKNPVCSPTEDLIAYSGEQVGPVLPVLAVRSDGTPVEISEEPIQLRVRSDWLSFLPDGTGLVYINRTSFAQDFWLLDLSSHRSRQLTELAELGHIGTFVVTADGGSIVFDRVHPNSDVVLIELPERGVAR